MMVGSTGGSKVVSIEKRSVKADFAAARASCIPPFDKSSSTCLLGALNISSTTILLEASVLLPEEPVRKTEGEFMLNAESVTDASEGRRDTSRAMTVDWALFARSATAESTVLRAGMGVSVRSVVWALGALMREAERRGVGGRGDSVSSSSEVAP